MIDKGNRYSSNFSKQSYLRSSNLFFATTWAILLFERWSHTSKLFLTQTCDTTKKYKDVYINESSNKSLSKTLDLLHKKLK